MRKHVLGVESKERETKQNKTNQPEVAGDQREPGSGGDKSMESYAGGGG